MQVVLGVLAVVLWVYLAVLTGRALLSWMPILIRGWRPEGPVRVAAEVVAFLTDPPLAFLGRFVPVLRLGPVNLELSFLLLYLVILWLARTLWWLA
jgi:YggT family protein